MTFDTSLIRKLSKNYIDCRIGDKNHSKNTLNFTKKLLANYPMAKEKATIVASLLHDIGWSKISKSERDNAFILDPKRRYKIIKMHEVAGAKLSLEILTNLDFKARELNEIQRIILNHDEKTKPLSIEEKIVRDSDKLCRYTKKTFLADVKRFKITPIERFAVLEQNLENWFYLPESKKLAISLLTDLKKYFKINNIENWNDTYKTNRANLPWSLDYIPEWFIKNINFVLGNSRSILDIGCGEGNYAKYVAQKGFNVLGIDFSKRAIQSAKKSSSLTNLQFKVMSAFDLSKMNKRFDSAYEVSLFHHISPHQRKKYAEEVSKILKKQGKFLMCCFSDGEKFFKGQKEFINPETGTITYPLSKKEIIDSFSNYFTITNIEKIYFGKFENRERWLVFMKKK
jgi:SAM-dependent methyltransferase